MRLRQYTHGNRKLMFAPQSRIRQHLSIENAREIAEELRRQDESISDAEHEEMIDSLVSGRRVVVVVEPAIRTLDAPRIRGETLVEQGESIETPLGRYIVHTDIQALDFEEDENFQVTFRLTSSGGYSKTKSVTASSCPSAGYASVTFSEMPLLDEYQLEVRIGEDAFTSLFQNIPYEELSTLHRPEDEDLVHPTDPPGEPESEDNEKI